MSTSCIILLISFLLFCVCASISIKYEKRKKILKNILYNSYDTHRQILREKINDHYIFNFESEDLRLKEINIGRKFKNNEYDISPFGQFLD